MSETLLPRRPHAAWGGAPTTNPILKFLFILFACFSILFPIYSSAVNIDYAHQDQYRFMHEGVSQARECIGDPVYRSLYVLGRPVAAEIECLGLKVVNTVGDYWKTRLATILAYAICATILANWLATVGFGFWPSIFLGSAIFTVHGVQSLVNFGSIPQAVSIGLALVASLSLSDPPASGRWWTRLLAASLNARVVWAFFLLLLAHLAYPVTSYFFLVPLLVLTLISDPADWPVVRLRVARGLGILGCTSVVYIFLGKLVFFPLRVGWNMEVPPNYRFEFTSEAAGRIAHFFDQTLPFFMNLWDFPTCCEASALPTKLYPITGAIIVAGLAIAAIIRIQRRRGARSGDLFAGEIERIIAVAVLMAIGVLPVLLGPIAFVLFRIYIVLAAMLVILVFWGGFQLAGLIAKRPDPAWAWPQLVPAFLLLAWGGAVANLNTTQNALNSALEFSYLRTQLSESVNAQTLRIHVTEPRVDMTGFNGRPSMTDEFNVDSTRSDWIVPTMVRAALLSLRQGDKNFVIQPCIATQDICIAQRPDGRMVATVAKGNVLFVPSPGTVHVDMNELERGMGLDGPLARPLYSETGPPVLVPPELRPILIRPAFHGYNIVSFNKRFWGFRQGFAPDYTNPKLPETRDVIVGDSEADVAQAIETAAAAAEAPSPDTAPVRDPKTPVLRTRDLNGYNVVEYDGRFWGFKLGFLPNYADPRLADTPGVLVGTTEDAVKAMIDRQSSAN